MLQRLVFAMRPLGYDPTVVSLTGASRIGEELQDRGVPVVALGGKGGILLPSQLSSLAQVSRTFQPQVIHCWMYHANLVGYGLARLRSGVSKPVLLTSVRAAIDAPGQERMSIRMIRRLDSCFSGMADAIVFNSNRGARQHAAAGYCMKRATVIPNFFDTEHFRPRADERRVTHLALGGGRYPVVALVGRFHPLKGHQGFLEAAGAVRRRFPESMFLLVGRGCDDGNQKLRGWINDYGLEGAVKLLGERCDVAAILNAVDLVVSSSLSEGFPNVIGEAMACGTPCVVTDVGDSRVLVGETGLVVPPSDAAAMAGAITDVIELPERERRGLGEMARQRVMTEFGMAPIVNRFVELYADCIRARATDAFAVGRRGVRKEDVT
jgi:glycosyltransferase involved in cell wall biosynthesis